MKRYLVATAVGLFCVVNSYGQAAEFSPNVAARMAQLDKTPSADLVSEVPYKLPWDFFAERSVAWKHRIWRVIDAGEVGNEIFAQNAKGGTPLIAAMIRGVMDGKLKAYSAENDRFTKEITADSVKELFRINFAKPKEAVVSRYMIKEEWLLSSEGRLEVRIIGIAPLAKDSKGEDVALFWLFYPANREYMAGAKATPTDNWDEVMEKRYFKSKVTKEGPIYKGKPYPKEITK